MPARSGDASVDTAADLGAPIRIAESSVLAECVRFASMMTELGELGANVDRDPREVAHRASQILDVARADNDDRLAALAATLLARARRNLGEFELAELAIDEAIARADTPNGDVLADAHLVAASVATFRRGSDRTAFHLDEAERVGSRQMRTQVVIQRAVLAKREGRLDEALDLYERVLPMLRESGDDITTARVLSNRGSLHVLRGNPGQALTDFAASRAIFDETGQEFAVVLVIENMAWAMINAGDVPAALALLDDAHERAATLDHHLQHASASRAEALMTAGLFADAAELLPAVVDALLAEGDRAGAAEALLLHAEASRLAGQRSSGELATRALELFGQLGLAGFEQQAQLELLRATIADDRADAGALDRAEGLAVALAGAGQARSEVEAWSLAASLALTLGDKERARTAAQRCARRASSIPFVEHRLAAAHATAAVQAADGKATSALATVTAALDEFDAYRGTFGSPDARTGSALHTAALVSLGSRLVATLDDAGRMLAWSEHRRRAVSPWSVLRRHAGRPTDDAIAEHRSVLTELREAETSTPASGRPIGELYRRRTEIEEQLRDRLLAERGERETDLPYDLDAAVIGDHIGVSLDVYGDRLFAVVVARGSTRLVDLGDPAPVLAAADAAVRQLAGATRGGVDVAVREAPPARLTSAIERLDRLVLSPLDLGDGPVVLAMPPELQAAPWASSEGLRRRSVSLVPSLGWWSAAPDPWQRAVGRVTAIAGPRLQFAETEVKFVAACHHDVDVLDGAAANAEAVFDAFRTSDVVHLAAHTRVRRDNPMWSTIELVDGPLFLHQLARHADVPSLVVLSTCESALATGRPGAALPGFAGALLEIGAQAVVASSALLPDDLSTCRVLEAFHRHLAAGVRPAAALAQVRAERDGAAAATALTVWGRG